MIDLLVERLNLRVSINLLLVQADDKLRLGFVAFFLNATMSSHEQLWMAIETQHNLFELFTECGQRCYNRPLAT